MSNEQMQRTRPSGSSNPREISNNIKAFFMSQKRDAIYIQSFRSFLEDNADSLDIINAISLIDGCARVGMSYNEVASWEMIETAMAKFNFMISSSMVTKAFSALSSLRLDEQKTKKYFRMLWGAVKYPKVFFSTFSLLCSLVPSLISTYLFISLSIYHPIYLSSHLSYLSTPLPYLKGHSDSLRSM
jgi:hypothetical protein